MLLLLLLLSPLELPPVFSGEDDTDTDDKDEVVATLSLPTLPAMWR